MNFVDYKRFPYDNKIQCKYNILSNRVFINEVDVPVNRSMGYIELYVFTHRGQFAIPGALITVYSRGDNEFFPIYNTSSQSYPIIITIPIAYPNANLIKGPEYYFSTYDITVEHENFAPFRYNNVRLFEGITMRIDVNLIPLIQGQYPIPQTIVNIPPHPRDLISQKYVN